MGDYVACVKSMDRIVNAYKEIIAAMKESNLVEYAFIEHDIEMDVQDTPIYKDFEPQLEYAEQVLEEFKVLNNEE